MIFDFFKKIVGIKLPTKAFFSPSHGEQATNGHLAVFEGDEVGDLAVTRYPPFDKGIPLVEIETLLLSQEDLIIRIFRTAGVSREEFSEHFEPPIRNLAQHVHLLPATSTTYFRGTGGLFRMSLEVALNALQTANAAIFPISGGVERRFYIQPKWSLAVFLAGLCSQNYRTLNSMVVVSRDNLQWAPLLNHLYDWAEGSKIDRYHVRWLEETKVHGGQASGAYSISQIVPVDVLQFLASDNNQILQAMTAAITGVDTNASENPVLRIVAPIVTRVIEEDLNRSATNYGHLVIGAHLEPHLVDAMRRLVRGGKWVPNQQGGRVWIGREGIFIDWVEAAADISLLLGKDSFAGVPKDPDTLAELLVNAGLLEMNKTQQKYWTIALPVSLEARDTTVKLREGVSIFPHQFDYLPYQNVQLMLVTPVPHQGKAKPRDPVPKQRIEPQLEPIAKQHSISPSRPVPSVESMPVIPETQHIVEMSTTHLPQDLVLPDDDIPIEDDDPTPHDHHSDEDLMMPPKKHVVAQPEVSPKVTPGTRNAISQKGGVADSKKRSPLPDVDAMDRLLASLQPNSAAVIKKVIAGYRNTANAPVVFFLPYGVGISHQELTAHGIPVMELFEELAKKQWLWIDKTKPSRKIHPIDVFGVVQRLMVLKSDIANGLGIVEPS